MVTTVKTKAEQLREVTNKAQKEKQLEKENQHKRYVDKLISGKLHLCATLGRASAVVKVRKKYSPTLVCEEFQRYGFEVKQTSKNGRAILTIKW
jgi:hypothetical protein